MELSEIYSRAADAIETYGQNKGFMGSTEGGFCINGSLLYVIQKGDMWGRSEAYREASATLDEYWQTVRTEDMKTAALQTSFFTTPENWIDHMIGWNYHPDTTKDEVVAFLRQASKAFSTTDVEETQVVHAVSAA